MKSKLAIAVILFGWVIFITYILAEYREYGSGMFKHIFTLDNSSIALFHRVFILTAPIGSGIVGYLINERKKLLEKTQLSEKQIEHAAREWRVTFDSMPYGIMLIDSEFNVSRANSYMANLSGIPVKELILDKKYYETIHKSDAPIDGCPLVKSVKTQSTETLEYHDSALDKYFRAIVTPVFREKNTPGAYVYLLIDITDAKEKETKLTQAKDAFFNMLKDIDTAHKEVKELYYDLTIAFSNVIDAKSPWTKNHSRNVTAYAVTIARKMGLREQDIEIIRTAGLLHDIGKIGTYDVILDKPDKLTDEEFALVKKHTVKGEEILKPIKGLENILPMIRSHHERIDGTGYPDGLKGEKIPFFAKILCVADAYDSMISERPYRPAPGKDYAISELKRCSGTQFDAEVVKAFLSVLERGEEIAD
jgi:putative nucleotidyltransferase with HDIG domain